MNLLRIAARIAAEPEFDVVAQAQSVLGPGAWQVRRKLNEEERFTMSMWIEQYEENEGDVSKIRVPLPDDIVFLGSFFIDNVRSALKSVYNSKPRTFSTYWPDGASESIYDTRIENINKFDWIGDQGFGRIDSDIEFTIETDDREPEDRFPRKVRIVGDILLDPDRRYEYADHEPVGEGLEGGEDFPDQDEYDDHVMRLYLSPNLNAAIEEMQSDPRRKFQ